MIKVGFIGCVTFSSEILGTLIENTQVSVVGVITRRSSKANHDFVSLEQFSNSNKIPVYLTDRPNEINLSAWIRERKMDVLFCCGWPTLLKSDVLKASTIGVIGYHPTLLPKHRGAASHYLGLGVGIEGDRFYIFYDE